MKRHNGNILIGPEGHLIHIDFGFIFSSCPGGFRFESAPFKLTKEYMDILGGEESDMFQYFKICLIKGFLALRQKYESLVNILSPYYLLENLPCL